MLNVPPQVQSSGTTLFVLDCPVNVDIDKGMKVKDIMSILSRYTGVLVTTRSHGDIPPDDI